MVDTNRYDKYNVKKGHMEKLGETETRNGIIVDCEKTAYWPNEKQMKENKEDDKKNNTKYEPKRDE